ncbi:hypothetical protein SCHPADRAFT_893977 [Schizopora paradoxa]|uniref:F-box domain-containing protein n=1 Tax=Schizopora paradoxa TaxID=27342 RepID=A0A0H2RFG2_9AGAM|nr:hypothetical protein SCHPADRAFT_893977 [Schizopora paradoxa]
MTRFAKGVAAAKQVVCSLETAANLHYGEGELGFEFKHVDWESGLTLEKLNTSEIFDAKTMRELTSNHFQLQYIAKLTNALASSAAGLLARYERYLELYYAKLTKGFASLPDEVIGLIFEHAAYPKEEGPRYAIYLSQVSRRFRGIALSNKSLWSHLFFRYDTNLDGVEKCIDRCGNLGDAHIVIKNNAIIEIPSLKTFIRKCSRLAPRLRSISLFGSWGPAWDHFSSWNNSATERTLGGTLNQFLLNHSLTLPRLQELCLIQDSFNACSDQDDSAWSSGEDIVLNSWSAPNLHTLRCDQYIPPSFPFKTITFFSLKITFPDTDTVRSFSRALHNFLFRMPNLIEIILDLTNEEDSETFIGYKWDASKTDLPVLTSLSIRASDFPLPFNAEWVLYSFFGRFHMPNLEHLAIHFEWKQLSTYLSPLLLSRELPRFLHALTPDPAHQSLKHYSISLSHPPFKDDLSSQLREREKAIELVIPLDRIPFVTVLEVTTYGSVQFSLTDRPRHLGYAGVQVAQLRELHLTACQNMDEQGLRDAIQSLKSIGGGDMLERILVRNCDLLNDGIVEAVTGKRC